MNEAERQYIGRRLSRHEWQAVRDTAIENDISKGGVCDCRSGAINFWCSESDKPGEWTQPIVGGTYPVDLVGSVYFEFTAESDYVRTYVDLCPYSLLLARFGHRWRSRLEYLDIQTRESLITWITEKWAELLQKARVI